MEATQGGVGPVASVTAPGLTVLAVILFMGKVSGAHLNPAVSIAFALRRDFPWRRVPGYAAAQLTGASLACLTLQVLLGDAAHLGASRPGTGITDVQAFVLETILTTGLISTILGTASKAQNVGPLSALGPRFRIAGGRGERDRSGRSPTGGGGRVVRVGHRGCRCGFHEGRRAAPRGAFQVPAVGVHPVLNSLRKLWQARWNPYSWSALVFPRSRSRSPVWATSSCPNTGSTIAFRRA